MAKIDSIQGALEVGEPHGEISSVRDPLRMRLSDALQWSKVAEERFKEICENLEEHFSIEICLLTRTFRWACNYCGGTIYHVGADFVEDMPVGVRRRFVEDHVHPALRDHVLSCRRSRFANEEIAIIRPISFPQQRRPKRGEPEKPIRKIRFRKK